MKNTNDFETRRLKLEQIKQEHESKFNAVKKVDEVEKTLTETNNKIEQDRQVINIISQKVNTLEAIGISINEINQRITDIENNIQQLKTEVANQRNEYYELIEANINSFDKLKIEEIEKKLNLLSNPTIQNAKINIKKNSV